MTIAVIDIGTNTVLLLVAQFDSHGNITPLMYEQRVPRLGKGVDAEKTLQPAAMERVVEVLLEYRKLLHRFELAATVVCGTSAVRDATNRAEFASRIRESTEFTLEILDGDTEALWTYRGAIGGIHAVERGTVVDIGGGSTEITVGDRHSVERKISLNIGSVRLTERLFKHDPPTAGELETAIEVVEEELTKARSFDFAGTVLVGVAGTATTLAILSQGLHEFTIAAVTNYHLKKEAANSLFRTLCVMGSQQILGLSTVLEGRSDVIVAGALILREVMEHFKFEEMIVSERGVRYGLAIRERESLLAKTL